MHHNLPIMPFEIPGNSKNILITNTQYIRQKKNSEGGYDPDKLYVVYRDFDTKRKNLQIITNPVSSVYTTKPEFMDDFPTQREFMSLDKLDRHDVRFKDIPNYLNKILTNNLRSENDIQVKRVIDRSLELGIWGAKKEVHKWRHAYFSDYDIQNYVYTLANLYYEPKETILTKSFGDIETDILGFSQYDIDRGKPNIHAFTMIYDYDPRALSKNYRPQVFTFLLRDYKRYPQQEEFEKNLDSFYDVCRENFNKKLGDNTDYHIVIFDDVADLLYQMFKIQHILKPDFTGIWNMSYDILYIQKKCDYLGIPSEALFCHPDFKSVWMNYHLDQKYHNDFKNRGDHFNCLSYTKYVDQMLLYANRRKGGKDYGSNALDNIARIEVKDSKWQWSSSSTNVINAAVREYFNFVLYSIQDVVAQVLIERKVEDIDDAFWKGYDSGARIDKANRNTVALKELWNISHFQQGFCMGNNLNQNYTSNDAPSEEPIIDLEGDQEILKGALVGDPTNINKVGAPIFDNIKSDKLFLDCVDLDAASMYPSIKLKNNIARSTQYGRLIIDHTVSKLEYNPNTHLRGGEFLDDYETGDFLKLGTKWFKLKPFDKYITEFGEYLEYQGYRLTKLSKPENEFYSMWSKKMQDILRRIYPDAKGNQVKNFCKMVYERDLKDVNCRIYNNYDDIEYATTLISVIDWIVAVKPIITESGTLFKRHEEVGVIPGLLTIDNLLKKRKVFKKIELDYEEAGNKEMARLYNLKQNRVKVFVNSDYGVTGAPSSFSYNFHVAQSITSKGQTLISLTMTTFEDFLTDTIQFYDVGELYHFCNNIVSEDIVFDDSVYLNENKSIDDVVNRLLRKCKNIKRKVDTQALYTFLSTVDQAHLNRLYYKSNLAEFIENSSYIQDLIKTFSEQTSSFMNPYEPLPRTKKYLEKLKNVILEYCQYNFPYYGRVDRLINTKRNSVIVIDTDSNILTINKLRHKFQQYASQGVNAGKTSRLLRKGMHDTVAESEKLKSVNMIAVILTEVISRALKKFELASNVENSPLGVYSFKNEFYYNSLMISDGKKRYLGSITIREGKYLYPAKRDIKGYDFIKISMAPEFVRKYIEDTLFTHVISDNLDIQKAIQKFLHLETNIRESLTEGKKELLAQSKVKTMDAYKEPFSNGPFKAVFLWNELYPEQEIQLPASVNLVKLEIKSAKDITELALEDKELFDKLCEILAMKEMKTGISQIAIPLDMEIPKWILKYMDTETMVQKYMKLVTPIMEGIGVHSIYKTQAGKYLSNIVNVG